MVQDPKNPVLELADREVLFRMALMAVRKQMPVARWEDLSAPVRTAISVIHETRASTGHGVYFSGRPGWLTPELFKALDAESQVLRDGNQRFYSFHCWTPAAERGNALMSGEVRAWAEEMVGRPLGSAFVTYNYYEDEGDQAFTHVDQPEYEVSLLIILSHEHKAPPASALWMFPHEDDPHEVPMVPGDVVLFHGGSTVHQRTPVGADETVRILTLSFVFDDAKVPFP